MVIVFGAVEEFDDEMDKIGKDVDASVECMDKLDIEDPDYGKKLAEC